MRRALNVLSGQAYGKVDWVSRDKREVGMFIHSQGKTTRCVVIGPEIEGLLANNLLTKGAMVTAFGEVYARVFHRKENDSYEGEVICKASYVVPESSSREERLRGALYSVLKGTVLYWAPERLQLKTFFNFKEEGKPAQMTCSLHMEAWVAGMPEPARTKFLQSVRVGRSFTANCMMEASAYVGKAKSPVPCLNLLPLDFRLQD